MMVSVMVAYALEEKQVELSLQVPVGSDVDAVINRSGLLDQCPELDLSVQVVGVNSRVVPLNQEVVSGDRVEIYRPLQLSPMQARRLRAERAKEQG